jgi:hypothetical protein
MRGTDSTAVATVVVAVQTSSAPTAEVRDLIESGAARLDAARSDVVQLPLFEHLSAVIPGPDLLFGGAMLMVIMLVHAAGVRAVTNRVVRHSERILRRPTMWRADLLMSTVVLMLLALHVLEIVLWAASLVYSGLVPDWRIAGLFSGNTYTTLGYGTMVLPHGWEMLAPLVAISGLFTFGWSGSVLVDLVGRCQKIKDAASRLAAGRASGAKERGAPGL